MLLAQALRGVRRPVVVHPQFTEPEAALRAAGHQVERVLLRRRRRLPARPGPGARRRRPGHDRQPDQPHLGAAPGADVAALARPGRVLVVDEAFADTTTAPGDAGEPESLAGRRDLPGLVVLRSLTKTWGLAGLRIGYLLGAAGAADPAGRRPAALGGLHAGAGRRDRLRHRRRGRGRARDRRRGSPPTATTCSPARGLPGVTRRGRPGQRVRPAPPAGRRRVRPALRERGYAVRRGDTFPGLGPDWLRIAVRDTATTDAFVARRCRP